MLFEIKKCLNICITSHHVFYRKPIFMTLASVNTFIAKNVNDKSWQVKVTFFLICEMYPCGLHC